MLNLFETLYAVLPQTRVVVRNHLRKVPGVFTLVPILAGAIYVALAYYNKDFEGLLMDFPCHAFG